MNPQGNWEPELTTRAVKPLAMGLTALGFPAEEILRASGIAPADLENSEGKIPHRLLMRFWETAVSRTNDDNLALHIAQAVPIDQFGISTYLALSSPTLREACRRLSRYQRIIHDVTNVTFEETAVSGVLIHTLPGGRAVPRQPAEFLLALWLHFARLLVPQPWQPLRVTFAHATPSDTSDHQQLLGTAVQFSSGQNALHLPVHILDLPNQQADPVLLALLDDYASRLLPAQPISNRLSDQVRKQLAAKLPDGNVTAEKIAQALHISVRTLHRNLQQEETNFRELLRLHRHQQAVRLLANKKLSIADVAFLVGFSELSPFYRAFKSWTGKTPAEFRALTQ